MATSLYSNPFYSIRVLSADKKRKTNVDPSLVESVNIVLATKTSDSETEYAGASSIQLILKERSAEIGTTSERNAGYIVDLTFPNQNNSNYVEESELKKSSKNANKGQESQKDPSIFLFQSGNFLEVEWGYLSPKKRAKTYLFRVAQVSLQGDASGLGTTVITGYDLGTLATTLFPEKGKTFLKEGSTKEPASLKQTVFKLASTLGAKLEFNEEIVTSVPSDAPNYVAAPLTKGQDTAVQDKNAPLIMPRQMSIHDTLLELARQYAYSYEYDYDAQSQQYVVKFNYKKLRYAKQDFEFTFRAADSTVISYKVDETFGLKNSESNTSNNFAEVTDAYVAVGPLVEPRSNLKTATNTSTDVIKNKSEEKLGVSVKGSSITHPSREVNALKAEANNKSTSKSFLGTLQLVTLGDPSYLPGLLKVNNIGKRYSTFYRGLSVTHKLDAGGYICVWNATTALLGEGGVPVESKENLKEETVDVRIVEGKSQ